VEAEWDTLLAELCAPRFVPTRYQLEMDHLGSDGISIFGHYFARGRI
jgi:hypothetical protein